MEQTDRRALYRYIDPAAHYADTVSNNLTIIMFIKTLELIQITLLTLNFSHAFDLSARTFRIINYGIVYCWHCQHACVTVRCLSACLFLYPSMGPQQQTRCCRFAAVGPCWDRQTDRQTPYRYTGPPPHAGSANNIRYRN